MEVRTFDEPAAMGGRALGSMPPPEPSERSRRWLVLCLTSMAYVVGIAGLWSMVQTFERPTPLGLTPAGDSQTMPPLDQSIDIRDAHLSGPLYPKFKPETPIESGQDMARSDLQKRS